MDNWQALQSFWGSFEWPAYDEQTAFPEGYMPAFPHITYESGDGDFGRVAFLVAHLWDKDADPYSVNWAGIKQKASEIKDYIGQGGVKINVDGGQIWIKIPDSMSFAMPIGADPDDPTIKRILLNVEVEFLSV